MDYHSWQFYLVAVLEELPRRAALRLTLRALLLLAVTCGSLLLSLAVSTLAAEEEVCNRTISSQVTIDSESSGLKKIKIRRNETHTLRITIMQQPRVNVV